MSLKLSPTSQPVPLSCFHLEERSSDSPFVVLAVEEAVENVTERANVVQVVQDDHSGELRVHPLRVALFCQGGQVLPQILWKQAFHKGHILSKNKVFIQILL